MHTYLVLGQRPHLRENLVYGFFDAAFMDDTWTRHSTMAYVFFVGNSVVSWSSKKQTTLALSTTEAEYLSGTEATKEAIWIKAFLMSIGIPAQPLTPILLLGDNVGTNALSHNLEYHYRTKHIHGRQCFITEMVEAKLIKVDYISTTDMVANGMTKPLPRPAFCRFMDMLGLRTLQLGEVGLACVQIQGLQCRKCGLYFNSRNTLHKLL